ncbi:MAG: intradiol ring-cleavage dioxygenase [Myxococcota bacterium]
MRIDRRCFSAGLVAGIAWPIGIAARERVATPSLTEGPFYPERIPEDHDWDLTAFNSSLAPKNPKGGERRGPTGTTALLQGHLRSLSGTSLPGVNVEIWQCDAFGKYHHVGATGEEDTQFQGYGRTTTDETGLFRFRTLRPFKYGNRTPHIHCRIVGRLTTQLFDRANSRENASDWLYQNIASDAERELVTLDFRPDKAHGLKASFRIIVD